MSAEAAASPANPGKPSRWTIPPWLAAWAMPAVLVAAFGTLLMVMLMEFHSLHLEIQDLRTETLAAIERQSSRIDETNVRIDQTNVRIDETNASIRETNERIDETNASVRETNVRIDETNVRIDGIYERLPPPG